MHHEPPLAAGVQPIVMRLKNAITSRHAMESQGGRRQAAISAIDAPVAARLTISPHRLTKYRPNGSLSLECRVGDAFGPRRGRCSHNIKAGVSDT